MQKLLLNYKSNKAFTLQDITVGLVILMLMTGTIFGLYVMVYKVQCDSALQSQATTYAIQILENTDKISYEEVKNGMEETYKTLYEIPDKFNISMNVIDYNEENTIKKIELTISYNFDKSNKKITFDKFKVKEL